MKDESIVRLVQNEIRAARAQDIAIDMSTFGIEPGDDGIYGLETPEDCSVCAIGAVLLNHPARAGLKDWTNHGPALDFADRVGRSSAWGYGFSDGSIDEITWGPDLSGTDEYKAGYALGERIRKWVERTEEA